jgi:predicted membrane protein
MARRARRARAAEREPRPLPPERRTVGQLVGETIRTYERRFWKALGLGLPVAAVNLLVWSAPEGAARYAIAPAAALLVTLAYVGACSLVTGAPLRSRSGLVAYATGLLVFVPFLFLVQLYILPGLAYLALVGLAVPAALVERLGVRTALARGVRLAQADYVHVLGSLATLALVVLLTQAGLFFLLREYAENTRQVAAVLASLVVSPVVLLGAALLYVDQEARLRSRGERGKE